LFGKGDAVGGVRLQQVWKLTLWHHRTRHAETVNTDRAAIMTPRFELESPVENSEVLY
jgi:hypothetical protein